MEKSLENQTKIILDSIADGVFTVNLDRKITRFYPIQVERNKYEYLSTVVIATILLRNIY